MKLSVITVCRNARETIGRTIASVLTQTYPVVEYIIVDGDSQDGTQDVVQQYRNQIHQFISEPDHNLWEAMNKGIRLATGDFLYFLNSDDYLIDDRVFQDAIDFLKQHPACDLLYGDIELRLVSGKQVIQKSPQPEDALEAMVTACAIPHSGSFIRASLFQTLGGYREDYRIGSDYAWTLQALQHDAVRVDYFPRVVASFYSGGLSSNYRLNMSEMFALQNQTKIYQTEPWMHRRVELLQAAFLKDYVFLQKVQCLSEERRRLIAAMEQQIAWYITARQHWVALKRRLGLIPPEPTKANSV